MNAKTLKVTFLATASTLALALAGCSGGTPNADTPEQPTPSATSPSPSATNTDPAEPPVVSQWQSIANPVSQMVTEPFDVDVYPGDDYMIGDTVKTCTVLAGGMLTIVAKATQPDDDGRVYQKGTYTAPADDGDAAYDGCVSNTTVVTVLGDGELMSVSDYNQRADKQKTASKKPIDKPIAYIVTAPKARVVLDRASVNGDTTTDDECEVHQGNVLTPMAQSASGDLMTVTINREDCSQQEKSLWILSKSDFTSLQPVDVTDYFENLRKEVTSATPSIVSDATEVHPDPTQPTMVCYLQPNGTVRLLDVNTEAIHYSKPAQNTTADACKDDLITFITLEQHSELFPLDTSGFAGTDY